MLDKVKILGTIITDKLDWDENCNEIIKKVNKRMLLLKKIISFGATREEMVHIWIVYCRSLLEQSAVVWSSSLTQENIDDLERTQKSFAKLILKNEFRSDYEESYENALMKLNLQSLEQRREELCLNFAKNCIKNEKLTDLFPENEKQYDLRNTEKYKVLHANTERLRKSSVIHMQNLLNTEARNQQQMNQANI